MLFSSIRYAFTPSLQPARQKEISNLLDANGASMADFAEATHIISNTLHFEGREIAPKDVQIVTDEWVDRSMVFGKLQDPKLFSADPLMIFSGVVACAADLEPCDMEVIAAGINALGGLFREGYTRDCTHVLVPRSGSDKYATAMHYASSTRVRVVLPHWFDDCFKLLVRLPEEPYAWPDPPLLRSNYALTKARLPPMAKAIVKSAVLDDEAVDKLTALGQVGGDIWRGKRILLSSTLNLAGGRRDAVEASVQRAGGSTVELSGDESVDVDSADVYIIQRRIGKAFIKATRANKIVGTLSWLFSVHKSRIITSPKDQLLHFPAYTSPVPGFEKHKVTASNYEGDARRYLKKLIELMGGEFTPQMTAANTVVVAAFIKGEKTTKAREWNIPVVNHTWLEDCFASWMLVTPAQEKYVSFPPGINFGGLVGNRSVLPMSDEELLEIERANEEMEMEKFWQAADEYFDAKDRAYQPAAQNSQPRIDTTKQITSMNRPAANHREGQPSPSKSPATKSNDLLQQKVHKTIQDMEEIQPRPRTRRAPRRQTDSDEESDPGTALRRRAIHTSPAKHSRKEYESDSDNVTRGPAISKKLSPTKLRAKVEDQREDENAGEQPRRLGKPRTAKQSTPRLKQTGTKRKSTMALFDDEFPSSSDEGLSPIRPTTKDKIPADSTSTTRPKQGRALTSRGPVLSEDEEDDHQTAESVPKAISSRTPKARNADAGSSTFAGTSDNPKTPLRKRTSLAGTTAMKNVVVEIPSPQKAFESLSRTNSLAAVAYHSSPKRGRPGPRARTPDTEEQENESPLSSPGSEPKSPSKARRFAADALQRSSQPTPIISATNLQRTPSRRQAASKAIAKLHENALDINKFEKEKRANRVRGAWEDGTEKSKLKAEQKPEETRKRRASALQTESGTEDATNAGNKKKRKSDGDEKKETKKAKKPPVSTSTSDEEVEYQDSEAVDDSLDIRLMTTQVVLSDQVLKGLRQLGVQMATKPTECTLLVANTIGRTEKFLCAMATARSIVTENWAIDSVKAKRTLPPDDYFLKDPEGERKHRFKLAEALRRARSSPQKLLEGHTFYFTKGLHRSEKLTTYKAVIHSAGGKVKLENPTVRILKGHKDRHVISVEGDSAVTDPLKEAGFHIYVAEFILVGVLTQRMDWDNTPHRLDKNR